MSADKFRAQYKAMKAEAVAILAEVQQDGRHHYPAANVEVNAPLALIQVELKAMKKVAERILEAGAKVQ